MPKLIFVYNADSGFMNGMFDFFHKLMKPRTYSCDLCVITHKHTGMRKAWKNYMKSLKVEKDYLHKDEFQKRYPNQDSVKLPAVFFEDQDLMQIISSEELKGADLNEFTKLLKMKISSNRIIV